MTIAYNKKVIFLFIILLLIFVSEGQHARRGGGSKRKSLNGPRSGSLSHRNYYKNGEKILSTGETIAIVAGSVGCAFCCIGVAVSDWKSFLKSFIINKTNDNDVEFEKLKSIKNNVSTIIMRPKYYQKVKKQFLHLISAEESIFSYTINGKTTRIFNTKVKDSPEGEFIDKIELIGKDEAGSWKGRGYFLASVEGPYVWWMKDYDNKEEAGQVGESQFLIYESTSYFQGRWEGRWYYEGDKNDQIYSGSWDLYDPTNEFSALSPDPESPRKWNPYDALVGDEFEMSPIPMHKQPKI